MFDRNFERQRKHEKKWKKDMKDELRTFIKDELEDVFTTCLDVEKITLRNTMAEYKNSFDTGVQELTTVMSRYENSFDRSVQGMAAVCKEKEVEIGDKLHQQVQASLDQHHERVVNEVKRSIEATFSLLERKSRVGIKSIVKGLEETCSKMKTNVAVIRSVVGKNELTCNQINKSVTSLGTNLTSLEEHVLSKVDNENQDDASSYVSPPEDDDESMDSGEEDNSEVDADPEDKEGDGIANPNDEPKRKKRKRSKKTKITKPPRGYYRKSDDDNWREKYGKLLDYCTNQVEYTNSENYKEILNDLVPEYKLGNWAQNQRSAYQRNAYTSKRYPSGRNVVGISPERMALLEEVPGWKWKWSQP